MRPTRTESGVSLFKTDHSENQEGPLESRGAAGMEMGQYTKRVTHPCELFDTESENDLAQGQQMLGAFKPPAPKRLCGIRAYKTSARPRWGLCFLSSSRAYRSAPARAPGRTGMISRPGYCRRALCRSRERLSDCRDGREFPRCRPRP